MDEKGLTKSDLTEMAINGEFEDGPKRFVFAGTVLEIFDDGHSPGLFAVEIWHGERLGNECYVSSYLDGLFFPTDDEATNK